MFYLTSRNVLICYMCNLVEMFEAIFSFSGDCLSGSFVNQHIFPQASVLKIMFLKII